MISAFLICVLTTASPNTDALWLAVCIIESGGNPRAYNAREKAAGIAQIRPICLRDCNRIAGYRRWTLADRYDPIKSREMFNIYVHHYAKRVPRKACTLMEARARIWNGGPTGWKKPSTRAYWKRVQAQMERDKP